MRSACAPEEVAAEEVAAKAWLEKVAAKDKDKNRVEANSVARNFQNRMKRSVWVGGAVLVIS
jgi:hypothetical protein